MSFTDIFLLYIWTRLDAVNGVAFGLMLVSGMAVAICGVTYLMAVDSGYGSDDKSLPMAKRAVSIAWKVCVGSLAVLLVTPNSKDVVLIMGGSAVLEAARSEPAKRIASKSAEAVEKLLGEYLEKGKPKSN